ncbi:MAG TPA: serine/threonine-protein kinase [Polyangiaceae bacterium]|nr:serine/threonine-protein kinase [Polyangiaceae bacterium]
MSERQNKVPPPPPRRAATSLGTGPRLTTQQADPSPASGALPAAAADSPPSSQQEEDLPTVPPPGGTRLKIVTISPGRASFADQEVPTGLRQSLRNDPYLGATIDGRYKVEAQLGEGGMGVVYRCTHTIIGKKVAMKVLRADLARDAEVTERFLNEAKAASLIGNAHIIDISDFGQFADGATYFVMEFLAGTPLSKALEGGAAIPISRIIHIARQLAEGLAAAHESGIVHRDLKPDNIFLIARGAEKDFVKILDFGIAKVSTSGEGKLTRAGAVFGTPHYMSPEQAAGAPVDHRGDVYSLGVILYEMASGRVPFDADNFMGILTQHMYKAPVPMRALVPAPADVPPGLEAIVLKSLSKRPEDRYQTMGELIADLDKLAAGQVPNAVNEMMARSNGFNVPADYFNKGQMPAPIPATPIEIPQKSRWPLAAGLAGVAAAVMLVVAIFAKSNKSDASSPSLTAEHQPAVPAPRPSAPPAPVPQVPAARGKEVVVAVEPLDAHVFRGDTDLGMSPVRVEVPEGHTLDLEVRFAGYKSQALKLDGSEGRKVVSLERVGKATTYRPQAKAKAPEKTAAPSAAPKKKSTLGGGEIVNPWDR